VFDRRPFRMCLLAGCLAATMLVWAASPSLADDGPVQILQDPVNASNPRFGNAIGVSGDVLAVLRPGPYLFIYRHVGGLWELDQTIEHSTGDAFEGPLAIDGEWIAVAGQQQVFVFRDSGGEFVEGDPISISPDDGHIVALALEGGHLILGLPEAFGAGENSERRVGAIAPFRLVDDDWVPLNRRHPVTPTNFEQSFAAQVVIEDEVLVYDKLNKRLYAYEFDGSQWYKLSTTRTDHDGQGNLGGTLTVGGKWAHILHPEGSLRMTIFRRSPFTWSYDGVSWESWGPLGGLGDTDHMISGYPGDREYGIWQRVSDEWVEIGAALVGGSQNVPRSSPPQVLSWVWQSPELFVVYVDAEGNRAVGIFDVTPRCFGESPTIVGTHGDDMMSGTDGPDVIMGLGGDDSIDGLEGDDLICGGPGDDTIEGGAGNDSIDGSSGNDVLTYGGAPGPVAVDFRAGTASGAAGADTFVSMNDLVGSGFDDDLRGGHGGLDHTIDGGPGDDTITLTYVGYGHVIGGDGSDLIDLSEYETKLVIDFERGEIRNSTFETVEAVIGTPFADTILGDSGPNVIWGGPGNDLIKPRGGDDLVDGGPGRDTLSYEGDPGPIELDLLTPFVTGMGLDVHVGFESFVGSDGDDTMLGSAVRDYLDGRGGDDYIDGFKGSDRLKGGHGDDILVGRKGKDRLIGGTGDDYMVPGPGDDDVKGNGTSNSDPDAVDIVSFETSRQGIEVHLALGKDPGIATGDGTDTLQQVNGAVGSKFADRMFAPTGGNLTEWLVGWRGADELFGYGVDDILLPGPGDDVVRGVNGKSWVSFEDATGPVTVNLRTGIATGMGNDRLFGIIGVFGGPHDDTITASGLNIETRLVGLGGADTITGGNRDDGLWGEEGDDRLFGNAGADYIEGNDGSDTANGGTGSDFCRSVESFISCETVRRASSLIDPPDRLPTAVLRHLEVVEARGSN